MKPKLILILIVIASMAKQTKAQPYQSLFGSTSTSWNVQFCVANCSVVTNCDSIWAANDTMVNGLHYKQIINVLPCFGVCLLREDTITGKTWFKSMSCSTDTTEHLIMDLNLTLMDSFFMYPAGTCFAGGGGVWVKVDSVYFSSGKKHIRFNHPTNGAYKMTFIEGTGPNMSFAYQVAGGGCPYVLCSYKNGTQVYTAPNFITIGPFNCCNSFASIHTTTVSQAGVSIYPHPVSGNSTLSFNNQSHAKFFLDVYTVNGAKITSFNTKSDSFILQKQGFADGIYFYHLYDAENKTSIYNKIMFVN